MLKRGWILLALALVVAIPFVLKPRQDAFSQTDDTVVVITPHNEAIRHEFALGFEAWYRRRTGRTVSVDWRVVGGTSEIARFLEGQYVGSFRNLWLSKPGRAWSAQVQSDFQNDRLSPSAPALARQARAAFLDSEAGCGIDVFFGGGPFDFARQAAAGRLVDSGVERLHPDWFTDAVFPERYQGEDFRDGANRWFGAVLSDYGILSNLDALDRLGIARPPDQWADLADPKYFGSVGLCDPTKSGSIAAAFENVIQQAISARLSDGGSRAAADASIRAGWLDGLRLIQLIGANARYFTDSSQKPVIDVADGNCAAGMCIDFYGREQEEAVRRRGVRDRLRFVAPDGGSAYNVDPIGLLRGAPHPAAAVAFMEYVLSLDGQKLWDFRTGTPGGPRDFELRRLPVRRDFYDHAEWRKDRSDPAIDPYLQAHPLVHHDAWTGPVFLEMELIVRVMAVDTHDELASAWKAVAAAPPGPRARAMAVLQDLSAVDYDQALGPIRKAIASKDKVEAVELARDLGERFRDNYHRAERIAGEGH